MPTVSVSSQLSETVYFVAIIGLGVLLARPVYLVYSGAQERSAQAMAESIAGVVDSMTPGSSTVLSLEEYPGVQLAVALSGTSVTAHVGGMSSSADVAWRLPQATLYPGESYNLTLDGGGVRVETSRGG